MKEYTVVTTVELTEILITPDEAFDEAGYKKTMLDYLVEEFGVDKADIKSCKVFPMEVEE